MIDEMENENMRRTKKEILLKFGLEMGSSFKESLFQHTISQHKILYAKKDKNRAVRFWHRVIHIILFLIILVLLYLRATGGYHGIF